MRSIKGFGYFVLLFFLGLFSGFSLQAQTFSEWFAQKKTQKKYLLEQIAALEVYVDMARKGYQMVGSGLETVRSISSGELGLHDAFFAGLKLVSPVVKGDRRVAEILLMEAEVARTLDGLRSGIGLDGLQLSYVGSVSAAVLGDCAADLEALLSLVLSGNVGLSDDERLLRLEDIYQRMLDKRAFVQQFSKEVAMLVGQRKLELGSLERLRRYYGLD